MRKVTFLLSIILLSSVSIIAQTNSKEVSKKVSDSELASFAEVFKEVQEISQESQNKMVKIIKDEGFDLKRYNAIARAQQNDDQDLEVSDSEIEKLKAIDSQLVEIESETQERLEKKLNEKNLTIERYLEIMELLQDDEQLQIRLQEHLKNLTEKRSTLD